MKYHILICALLLSIISWMPAKAQNPGNEASHDLSTIAGTIEALYASISGEKGEERDWDTFRNLFVEDARLIPTGINQDGQTVLRSITPQQYIEQSGPWLVENGFIEKEIHRKIDRFGPIAQIFSTYTSRNTEGGEIIDRGINSIQLFYDGSRWWVVTIYWSGETEETPIPPAYEG